MAFELVKEIAEPYIIDVERGVMMKKKSSYGPEGAVYNFDVFDDTYEVDVRYFYHEERGWKIRSIKNTVSNNVPENIPELALETLKNFYALIFRSAKNFPITLDFKKGIV